MIGRILVLVILLFSIQVSSEIVEVENGKIEGTIISSKANQTIFAFYQVPYAEPPIGDLRFQAPKPAKNWSNVRIAKIPGPKCYQPDKYDFSSDKSEDCLHLNVFTKNFSDLKPVVVWIHGGAFEVGFAGSINPLLSDRDFVYVTINYRLGPLGFIAMGTKEVPGNAGMKDQTLALKWIQKNIHNFGGDKNSVTIFGLSAGGISVSAHMASSMSANLFHRAFVMSGSITTVSDLRRNNLDLVEKLGKIMKCATNDILKCLKDIPAEQLVAADLRSDKFETIVWFPVIEDDFGQERFLTEDPKKTFASGNFNKVPLIAGRTDHEMIKNYVENLYQNFYQNAPKNFFFWENNKKSYRMSQKLRQVLNCEVFTQRCRQNYQTVTNDGYFGYPIYKLVELVSKYVDVYYFLFTNNYHGYIGMSGKSNYSDFLMPRMIESFAAIRNPNVQLNLFDWKKYNTFNRFYLEIGKTEAITRKNMYMERYLLWEEISNY